MAVPRDGRLHQRRGRTPGSRYGAAAVQLHVIPVDVLGGFDDALRQVEAAAFDAGGCVGFRGPPVDEGAHNGHLAQDAFLPEAFFVLFLEV